MIYPELPLLSLMIDLIGAYPASLIVRIKHKHLSCILRILCLLVLEYRLAVKLTQYLNLSGGMRHGVICRLAQTVLVLVDLIDYLDTLSKRYLEIVNGAYNRSALEDVVLNYTYGTHLAQKIAHDFRVVIDTFKKHRLVLNYDTLLL